MTTTRSLVATTASAKFEIKDVELRPLGSHDVKIDIIASEKVIAGSNTGGISLTQEMLDFCAANGIGSAVEIVDASNPASVDAAYDRVVAADVRYRFVIDASTI